MSNQIGTFWNIICTSDKLCRATWRIGQWTTCSNWEILSFKLNLEMFRATCRKMEKYIFLILQSQNSSQQRTGQHNLADRHCQRLQYWKCLVFRNILFALELLFLNRNQLKKLQTDQSGRGLDRLELLLPLLPILFKAIFV